MLYILDPELHCANMCMQLACLTVECHLETKHASSSPADDMIHGPTGLQALSNPLTLHRKLSYDTVAGAILVLGRDLVMVPKLIHPLPPTGPGTPKSPAYGEPIEEEPPTPHPMTDTWMQVRAAKSITHSFVGLHQATLPRTYCSSAPAHMLNITCVDLSIMIIHV